MPGLLGRPGSLLAGDACVAVVPCLIGRGCDQGLREELLGFRGGRVEHAAEERSGE
jgi:hypothetical protein